MTLKPDRQDKIFIGIVVLVHVFFFLLACKYTRIYMGDSFEYIYEALNIKRYVFFYSGNPAMPIVPEYMTQRMPGYPLFLLSVYLFTVNNWIVIILQNVLSIFNIYYARKAFINIGYSKKYDWLLLLFVVAYPAQFINADTIAPDILLQTFSLLYVGMFVKLVQQKELKYAAWMSVILVAGLMVKPVFYPFVIVHAVIVIFAIFRMRVKMQRPLVIAIAPLCAVLLYSYANYTRTDKFHFTSNQAFNAIYYYYAFISDKQSADSASHFLQKERNDIASLPEYKDRYDEANERGMALLEQNFGPYMGYHLKNSARIFIEPGKAELDLFTGALTYGRLYHKERTGFYDTLKNKGWGGMRQYMHDNASVPFVVIILLFNCLRLLGFILFFRIRNIPAFVRVFIFVFVTYFAIAAGPIANTRYFLPVSLMVMCCAVTGYISILQKRQPA